MAKLIALVLAFTALVAFATAHTTITTTTTTIEDHNPISSQRQCSQQIQGQRLNQCHMYLQQGQSPYENRQQQGQQQQTIQQCCQQLQNVDQQCQCEAVKQVLRDVIQQQQGQQQFGAGQQTRQLKQKAQMLPNLCNLQSRQCQIGNTMTTVSNFDIPFWPFGSQCSQSEIQKPVNQCQKYVEQQIWSPRTLQMSVNRKGQQQQQSLQKCCNKLQNVKRDCQCEAIKEVAREVMQQQQQQGGRRQGGQQDETTEIVWSVIQNLPNQCRLDVQQCNIPYGMF